MNRSLIKDIKFEYGRQEEVKDPTLDENYFINDKRNNILLSLTSIPGKSTMISYERAINPQSSFGGGVKIHGLGTGGGDYTERSGVGIEVNYKVKAGSVFRKGDYRPKHLLQGFYLRPDVGYTNASLEADYDDDGEAERLRKYSYIYGGADIGYEWIFSNRLSLDLFTGINFYGGSYKEEITGGIYTESNSNIITDGNMAGSNNTAIRYGFQVGFLF